MMIKVCGIKNENNYALIAEAGVAMIGLNFYPPSKRYVGNSTFSKMGDERRVGVFVQEDLEIVVSKVQQYQLDYAQVHGDESPEYCQELSKSIPVIKVFRVGESFDWSATERFSDLEYFLFDTYTKEYGGSGKKFDWKQIDNYKGATPFLMSGGIAPEDAQNIKRISHPLFRGVDINSRFEISPGIKDVNLIEKFIEEIKN